MKNILCVVFVMLTLSVTGAAFYDGPYAVATVQATNLMDRLRHYSPNFPQVRSKMQTNGTLNVMVFGDSEATQLAQHIYDHFVYAYGFSGFQGEPGAAYGVLQWSYTNNNLVTKTNGDTTSWPITYFWVTNGGELSFFGTNTSAIVGISGNILALDYVAENGAGTFKIRTNAGPGTTWADFQTGINANNGGVQTGMPLRYTNAFVATMMMQAVVTSGNPVRIIPGGIFNWPQRGTICGMFGYGGLDLTNMFKSPTNVTGPILKARNPDLVVSEFLDTSWDLGPTLPVFNVFRTNYMNQADWLALGNVPVIQGTNQLDVPVQDALWYSNQVMTGKSFFNVGSVILDTNTGVANGWLNPANDPHPTSIGDTYITDLLFSWANFFSADDMLYGAQRFMYQDSAGTTLTNVAFQSWAHSGAGDQKIFGFGGITMEIPQGLYFRGPRAGIGFDPNSFTPPELGFSTFNADFTCYQGGNFKGINGAGSYLSGDSSVKTNYSAGIISSNAAQIDIGGNRYPASYTTFTMTAGGSVTNITTTTNSFWGTGTGTRVLTNNFWIAGRTLTATIEGQYFDGGTPGGNRFLVMLNTTSATNVLAQSYFTPPVSIAGEYFKIEANLTCRTAGASGTIDTTGTILTVAAGTPTIRAFTNSVTTLDTTVAYSLDIATTNGASTDSWQSTRGNIVLQ